MKKHTYKTALLLCAVILFHGLVQAQKTASVKINSTVTCQKITGFGGFVNSGSFAYDWMTTDEIKKLWGKNSEAGYNIMRLYLPIGKSAWPQSLATAQLAQSLGIKIFASPWSMPAEWKTYNTINAIYTDANGVVQNNSLKEANYADYANYLNDYVTYLSDNGVKLEAISIQNEPDMKSTYAGCIWTPLQIATFVKNYGSLINCKIIAPESVGLTDDYANAFSDDNVSAKFGIFSGHQYSGIQTNYKNVQAKGHDVWMTEYLINWNADESTPTVPVTRDFNWTKDAFSFANKLNTAMLSNINAWVHYASRRFYGLMGDGTYGSTTGMLTKRGYILSHYAKYTTGTTRIQNTWNDDSGILGGSSYLSVTGDSVIAMVINPSTDTYTLTVDLPFYFTTGKSIVTTESSNMLSSAITLGAETCRPKITVSPSSFTTFIFTKSSVRPVSQMTGKAVHYNKIEDQTLTNAAFGNSSALSGAKVTFDHSNNLISANTTATNGYLKLNARYNQLVFHVDSMKSAGSFTSSATTLYYINSSGSVSTHNYGTVTFTQNSNFDWILDISSTVLTDGCIGILGISNGNYSSILTINLGDVYFRVGTEKMYKFTGVYSNGDSDFLNCMEDPLYTSLDFTGTSAITTDLDWNTSAAGKNCIFYVANGVTNNTTNVIAGSTCSKLALTDGGGNFYAPVNFTSTAASYTRTFNGYGVMALPFEANVPTDAKAYTMLASATNVSCTSVSNNKIPANTPVLIQGTGTFKFEGTGAVSTPLALKVNDMNGVYISVKAPAGSYYFKIVDGVGGFYPVSSSAEPTIIPFSAYLTPSNTVAGSSLPLKFTVTGIEDLKADEGVDANNNLIFDSWGRRIYQPKKGVVYIKGGKKVIFI